MPCFYRLLSYKYYNAILSDIKKFYQELNVVDGKTSLPGIPSYLDLKNSIRELLINNGTDIKNSDLIKPMTPVEFIKLCRYQIFEKLQPNLLKRNKILVVENDFLTKISVIFIENYTNSVIVSYQELMPNDPNFLKVIDSFRSPDE